MSSIRRAVVFSGGGARGAYEAGAIRYLLEDLPTVLGGPPPIQLILGTSVGAVHACFLGGALRRGTDAAAALREGWMRMRLSDLISQRSGLWSRLRLRRRASREPEQTARRYGLLDTSALEALVRETIDWSSLARGLAAGTPDCVCIAATEIQSGHMVAFVQSRNALDPRDWAHDPTIVPRQVELTPRHVLASAAIPLLFPAVRIENAFYSDGSLRLNTPLAPATHLGADRILVVTTKPEKSRPVQDLQPLEGPLSFFTRMLSAPLIDQLETDLGRMRFINKILETGEAAYGPDFLARLNRVSAESGDARTYRRIDDLVLRPSRDPSAMAAELLESTKMRERVPGLVRRLLDTSTGAGILRQRDALSVLLFEPEYIEALMELGRSDARAHERALVEFFSAEAREPANAAS